MQIDLNYFCDKIINEIFKKLDSSYLTYTRIKYNVINTALCIEIYCNGS